MNLLTITEDKTIIRNLINKLFTHVDNQEWHLLQNNFFKDTIYIDIIGIEESDRITGVFSDVDFCKSWEEFIKNTDARYRHIDETIIKIDTDIATVFTSITITHFKKTASKGATREYNGYYNFELEKTNEKWKISKFIYQLAYKSGNIDLE